MDSCLPIPSFEGLPFEPKRIGRGQSRNRLDGQPGIFLLQPAWSKCGRGTVEIGIRSDAIVEKRVPVILVVGKNGSRDKKRHENEYEQKAIARERITYDRRECGTGFIRGLFVQDFHVTESTEI